MIFLGADAKALTGGNVHGARTLEDAARAAVALAQGGTPRPRRRTRSPVPPGLPKLARGQRFIRGLFSGGTFCFQATMLLQEELQVHTNTPEWASPCR